MRCVIAIVVEMLLLLQRTDWETQQLEMIIDLADVEIDPAPFQLVEQTSIYKTHGLFQFLGLNRAYVTNYGQLVGVVSLREVS
jgi:hypothetical protein